MKQAQLQRAFMKRAQILAHVVTGSKNIKVTVHGNQAYRTPGLINLPAGDFTDPEWVSMTQGWIDHELGHEDETDSNITVLAANESKILNTFRQIIEDVRMERSRGIKYPGSRFNLNKLAELAIKKGLFADPTNFEPSQLMTAMCLYYGRSKVIGQECLKGYSDIAIKKLSEFITMETVDKVIAAVDKTEFAITNADSLLIAREILEILKDDSDDNADADSDEDSNDDSDDNADADSDEDSNDDSDDNADADSDEDSNDDSNDNAAADSDEDSNDDSNDNAAADSDEDSNDDSNDNAAADSDEDSNDDSNDNADVDSDEDSNEDSDDNADADEDSTQGSGTGDTIKQMLQEIEDADDEDFHEKLAELLGEDADEAIQENGDLSSYLDLDMVKQQFGSLGGQCDELLASRLSGNIYQTMHKVLFDQAETLQITRKTGSRIVNRRLSGVPAGNYSVFRQRIEQQDISAAVSVLVDASGSMGSSDENDISLMQHANTCALAFSKGLDKANVATETIYYGENDGSRFTAYNAKCFDAKTKSSNFLVKPTGYSTPTGDAMKYALNSLVLRPENRKMLIVLTDGDPDSSATVIQARAIAQAFDIAVVPIGIGTSTVKGFQDGEFITIEDPAELINALKYAVRLKLFQ